MSVQPKDTSQDRLKKSGPDVTGDREKIKSGKDDKPVTSEPNEANYGFGGNARLDTDREETQDQEYRADGLPRTTEYSVDQAGKGTKEQSGHR